MANVFNTAKYILEQKGTVSTMKLQKLCYYAQAWALVWDESPLFEEDFEAWRNGPVCPVLFNFHKGKYAISAADIPDSCTSAPELTDNQKDTIDTVLKSYGDRDAQWLSTLTHMEAPWKETREEDGCISGQSCSAVITKARMSEYYGSL